MTFKWPINAPPNPTTVDIREMQIITVTSVRTAVIKKITTNVCKDVDKWELL